MVMDTLIRLELTVDSREDINNFLGRITELAIYGLQMKVVGINTRIDWLTGMIARTHSFANGDIAPTKYNAIPEMDDLDVYVNTNVVFKFRGLDDKIPTPVVIAIWKGDALIMVSDVVDVLNGDIITLDKPIMMDT